MAIRPNFSALHLAGKLFQQFAVDACVKIEGQRLDFIRHNQNQLRAESYEGLLDYLENAAEGNLTKLNHMITVLKFQSSVLYKMMATLFDPSSLILRKTYLVGSYLPPMNEEALTVNEQIVELLPGDIRSYHSMDSVVSDDQEEANNYPLEFINPLTPTGMPPYTLNLKVNSIVCLLYTSPSPRDRG